MLKTKPGVGINFEKFMQERHHKNVLKKIKSERQYLATIQSKSPKSEEKINLTCGQRGMSVQYLEKKKQEIINAKKSRKQKSEKRIQDQNEQLFRKLLKISNNQTQISNLNQAKILNEEMIKVQAQQYEYVKVKNQQLLEQKNYKLNISTSLEDIQSRRSKKNLNIVLEHKPSISGIDVHRTIGSRNILPSLTKTNFNSQQFLPNLQLNSMRTRVKNQTDIFEDNLKLYQKLVQTKPRIPTKTQLTRSNIESQKIKKRISQYDIFELGSLSKSIDIGRNISAMNNKSISMAENPYTKTQYNQVGKTQSNGFNNTVTIEKEPSPAKNPDLLIRKKRDPMIEKEKKKENMKYLMKVQLKEAIKGVREMRLPSKKSNLSQTQLKQIQREQNNLKKQQEEKLNNQSQDMNLMDSTEDLTILKENSKGHLFE